MPEGDVVWYTARRLHEALAGRVLTRSDFRVPRLATADLTGDVVTETASRGKHLLTRTRGGLTVHTHLRMDGSWRIRPVADQFKDSHRIRLILANDEWQAVGYQLGVVELTPGGDALFARLREVAFAFDQRLRAGLTEHDVDRLEALLARLRDNVG